MSFLLRSPSRVVLRKISGQEKVDFGPFSLLVFKSIRDFLLTLHFYLTGVTVEQCIIFC